jgi:hypothetical protein
MAPPSESQVQDLVDPIKKACRGKKRHPNQ